MSLRVRIAVTAAVAVAMAVLLVAVGVYGTTARQLRATVDGELEEGVRTVLDLAGPDGTRLDALTELRRRRDGGGGPVRDRFLGPLNIGTVQYVAADGVAVSVGPFELPVDEPITELATRGGDPVRRTVDVDGSPVRVLAVQAGDGVLQVALPITDVERALTALRRQLLLAGILGAGLAALFGAVVADRAIRPVRSLTDAAEDVRRTQDLDTRIDVGGEDELARLGAAFNGMLASLDVARRAQQQLVADASHELRTPLTSLRTNIDVLQLEEALPPGERSALLADVTGQLEELGRLVDGLVELARGDRPALAPTPVALGELVGDVVDRSAVLHPGVAIELDADPSVVVAERDRLERAVANLVDNAVKHGGGTPVTVTVRDGTVEVRDRGPGVGAADLPHVFDRFYRAPTARSLPGSGLGLSIVAQVAQAHGGRVHASTHADGGAVIGMTLPTSPHGPGTTR